MLKVVQPQTKNAFVCHFQPNNCRGGLFAASLILPHLFEPESEEESDSEGKTRSTYADIPLWLWFVFIC